MAGHEPERPVVPAVGHQGRARGGAVLPSLAGVLVGLLAGCGGGGGGGGADTHTTAGTSVAQAPAKTVTSPPRTAPATTPTMSTPTPAPTPTPKPKKKKGEGGAGGAGDEEGNFIPVNIAFAAGGRARPPVVQVPAFFALNVTLRNGDHAGHAFALSGPGVAGDRATVAGGKSVSYRVHGGKPTTYRVLRDGTPRARIVTGANPGP